MLLEEIRLRILIMVVTQESSGLFGRMTHLTGIILLQKNIRSLLAELLFHFC
jgi:hypothetical protein